MSLILKFKINIKITIHHRRRRILLVLRWICMRYERNKLKKELEELKSVEWVKVHKENLQLRKTLEEIKKIINQ
jgi:coenzyme F420-reducing hydrogenase beta subunit